MSTKEDSSKASGPQKPSLLKKTRIVTGVQQPRRQVPQRRGRGLLRLGAALGGEDGDLCGVHALGVEQERIAVVISNGFDSIALLFAIRGPQPIETAILLEVLALIAGRHVKSQACSVHHLHEGLHIEAFQVHVSRVVVLGSLRLIRQDAKRFGHFLKFQFRIFIIWIFIWVKAQGPLPICALDVVRFGTAGDAKYPVQIRLRQQIDIFALGAVAASAAKEALQQVEVGLCRKGETCVHGLSAQGAAPRGVRQLRAGRCLIH
mmetsp:Transcript_71662/g.113579  ORF Transcript_71662/g.113579 Transcript_71662/m.113579 type:complete len:262 (-) Transcript_71662:28-813(-)